MHLVKTLRRLLLLFEQRALGHQSRSFLKLDWHVGMMKSWLVPSLGGGKGVSVA